MHIFRDLKLSFAFSSKDIPVCQVRVIREKEGMPWNERVAIHPLKDGRLEITPIKAPKKDS